MSSDSSQRTLGSYSSEELAEAHRSAGSFRGAAAALGVAYGSPFRAKVSAALLGPAAPPAGFTPVKVTTNGQGLPVSVQAVPEPDQDDREPVLKAGNYVKRVSSYLNAAGATTGQWVIREEEKRRQDEARFLAVRDLLSTLPPLPLITLPTEALSRRLCNVIIFGDPHFGMLAQARETGEQSWDMAIARRIMSGALEKLLARLPPAESFCLIDVGDYFHFENNAQVTPRGSHKQDGDGRFTKMAEAGCYLLADLARMCLATHCSGTLINVPGNHDESAARWLNLWCRAFFRQNDRLRIEDNADPFNYLCFGENLIGTYHGDGAATKKLPGIMAAHDGGRLWGKHRHRRWVTGHHHIYAAESYPGVLVEKFPTLAPVDMWSHWKGFDGAERSLNAITLHETEGEIGRTKVFAAEVG